MWNRKHSTTLSIVACIFSAVVLTVALFIGPWFVKTWFSVYRGWDVNGEAVQNMVTLFVACFYPCTVFAYVTLYSLLRLLFNIRKEQIFISPNVKYLRHVSWCCFAVALITFVGGMFYVPFFFVMAPAAFVGLMLRVVKNIMQNAVEINEENELTI